MFSFCFFLECSAPLLLFCLEFFPFILQEMVCLCLLKLISFRLLRDGLLLLCSKCFAPILVGMLCSYYGRNVSLQFLSKYFPSLSRMFCFHFAENVFLFLCSKCLPSTVLKMHSCSIVQSKLLHYAQMLCFYLSRNVLLLSHKSALLQFCSICLHFLLQNL